MRPGSRVAKYEYILGDSSYEVRRLAFQAGVWRDMTEGLFDRLGVGPGWKCLEVGPGTGTVLLPLAARVRGRGGRLDAVERSPRYLAYLRRKLRGRGFDHVRLLAGDLLDAPLEKNAYDLIFARWVFLFLPRVEEHLARLARALKPGGFLAIEDYHRDSVAIYPRLPSWRYLVTADRAWFASQGGDLNVAGRLPKLFRRAGLRVHEIVPHVKVGRPGSDVWKWLEDYFVGYLDRIAKFPPFTPARAACFRREWLAAKRDRDSLIISPMMLDVVGRK
ncbi:MAG: class I SAM-dependent methyltransferase [Elusimicrobia bacterium]|nr:class I SAM-dependent methyltransferase [Elusimicrobiota bacterium]